MFRACDLSKHLIGSAFMLLLFLSGCGFIRDSFDQNVLFKPSVLERARDRAERGEIIVIQEGGFFIKVLDKENEITDIGSSSPQVVEVNPGSQENILKIEAFRQGRATISFATREGKGGYFKVIVCPTKINDREAPTPSDSSAIIGDFYKKVYAISGEYPEDRQVLFSIIQETDKLPNTAYLLTLKPSERPLHTDGKEGVEQNFFRKANEYLNNVYGLINKYSKSKSKDKVAPLKTFAKEITDLLLKIQHGTYSSDRSKLSSVLKPNNVCSGSLNHSRQLPKTPTLTPGNQTCKNGIDCNNNVALENN